MDKLPERVEAEDNDEIRDEETGWIVAHGYPEKMRDELVRRYNLHEELVAMVERVIETQGVRNDWLIEARALLLRARGQEGEG